MMLNGATPKALTDQKMIRSPSQALIPLERMGLLYTAPTTENGTKTPTRQKLQARHLSPDHHTSVLNSSSKQSSAVSNCMGGADGASRGASNPAAPSPSALLGPL